MNATNHSTQATRDSASRRSTATPPTPATPAMQPVGKVLDLVAQTSRFDGPWYWRDRWAD